MAEMFETGVSGAGECGEAMMKLVTQNHSGSLGLMDAKGPGHGQTWHGFLTGTS